MQSEAETISDVENVDPQVRGDAPDRCFGANGALSLLSVPAHGSLSWFLTSSLSAISKRESRVFRSSGGRLEY
jgi:hypothetical protein